jgi:hypothetical protein
MRRCSNEANTLQEKQSSHSTPRGSVDWTPTPTPTVYPLLGYRPRVQHGRTADNQLEPLAGGTRKPRPQAVFEEEMLHGCPGGEALSRDRGGPTRAGEGK